MSESSADPTRFELADSPADIEVLESELLFEGRLLSIARDTFLYNGEPITREYVKHPGAVAVLVLDDQDRALVINQYRHPIRSREWEIPAGLLDVKDEPRLLAAKRELAEEADLEASDWYVLADSATTPGGSDEIVRVFLARGLTPTTEVFERAEEEADIVIEWLPIDELVAAIAAGTLRNSLLQVAVLSAYAARARGWQGLVPASR